MRRVIHVIAVSAVSGACTLSTLGCDAAADIEVPVAGQERVLEPMSLERLWRRGGSREDSLLYGPWSVYAAGGEVAVLDRGGYRVRTFDPVSGDLLWSVGRKGDGPMEFQSPMSVHYDDGTWNVWDSQIGRLTTLSRGGRLQGEQLIASDLSPLRFCALDGRTTAALLSTEKGAATEFSASWKPERATHFPLRGYDGLHPIQRQARWATDNEGRCVAVLTMASGFAEFGADGFGQTFGFVEAIEPPVVTSSESSYRRSVAIESFTGAVQDAFLSGSELWLLFIGTTSDAGRLIDVHDVDSGQYLRSYRLPISGITAMARDGDRLFVLRTLDAYPVLEAYQMDFAADSEADQTR